MEFNFKIEIYVFSNMYHVETWESFIDYNGHLQRRAMHDFYLNFTEEQLIEFLVATMSKFIKFYPDHNRVQVLIKGTFKDFTVNSFLGSYLTKYIGSYDNSYHIVGLLKFLPHYKN